jgi:uncharacterized membrane protein
MVIIVAKILLHFMWKLHTAGEKNRQADRPEKSSTASSITSHRLTFSPDPEDTCG